MCNVDKNVIHDFPLCMPLTSIILAFLCSFNRNSDVSQTILCRIRTGTDFLMVITVNISLTWYSCSLYKAEANLSFRGAFWPKHDFAELLQTYFHSEGNKQKISVFWVSAGLVSRRQWGLWSNFEVPCCLSIRKRENESVAREVDERNI